MLGLKSGADELTLARADRKRLGNALVRKLAGGGALAASDVHRVIPRRTWLRRKAEGGLTGPEFDALYRLVRLRALAELVFGDEQQADDWLRSPKTKLGGVSPLEFASDALGHQAIESWLHEIDQGYFA
jgi:putative toxin-antitoxin system antitoxin component (TIGR02293 family)